MIFKRGKNRSESTVIQRTVLLVILINYVTELLKILYFDGNIGEIGRIHVRYVRESQWGILTSVKINEWIY